MRRVADAVAETLRAQEIDVFFMLTGGDPALWTALQRQGIRMIPCRSEQGAAYMADGYARMTGRPTFVYGQHGPGSANISSALADAYWAMSPVVSLTSSVPAATRDRHEYQLLDQLAMHRPVTHWAGEALRGSHVRSMLLRAMHEATSAPGPAHLDIPRDVLAEPLEDGGTPDAPAATLRAPQYRTAPAPEAVKAIVARLSGARRVVIMAGSGSRVSGADPEVRLLAEALRAPVVTSIGGKASISEAHPLAVGVVGRYAAGVANDVVDEADLVLVLGSRLGSVTSDSFTMFASADLIRVDTRSDALDPSAALNVLADVKLTAQALLSELGADPGAARDTAWVASVSERVAGWRENALKVPSTGGESGQMHPREVVSALSESLAPSDVVVADTGYMAAWAGVLYQARAAGTTFLRAAGSLGWAIPGALGAQLAAPERRVVCVTGDGGTGYNIAELETAVRVGIPVTIVVVNNGTLAFEYHLQKYVEKNVIPEINDFSDVDYGAVARSLGAAGVLVRSKGELDDALATAARSEAPTLIDARVDREAIAPVTSYANQGIDPSAL
ncbi:acetolactate synthase catalytic subunit [Acrocarpospora macrocephala]|uniref:Acetolactate synthase large subunit n=1 Tax=Acrocarpospora macrocephala TaxID=150177 RepID=A0A5M3WPL0_9ACTN|nr:thiamine pyrophosphate-binding protein [Acrocarpospora macrocephala]GES11267.1 acetolactate synthase large subunit [Acrocarpospora macrocephala]